MYIYDDSYADRLIENHMCDKIDSLSPDSSNFSSLVTHVSNSTLELKPLSDSLKCIFLGPNDFFPVIIVSNQTEEQQSKLLKVLRKTKRL